MTARTFPAVGRHLLLDLHGVDSDLLRDEEGLMRLLADVLAAAGFTQVGRQSHKFPGEGGVTGVVLLSESHAAFHSYPEHGYLAVDIFSCGEAAPEDVATALCEALRPSQVSSTRHERGRSSGQP